MAFRTTLAQLLVVLTAAVLLLQSVQTAHIGDRGRRDVTDDGDQGSSDSDDRSNSDDEVDIIVYNATENIMEEVNDNIMEEVNDIMQEVMIGEVGSGSAPSSSNNGGGGGGGDGVSSEQFCNQHLANITIVHYRGRVRCVGLFPIISCTGRCQSSITPSVFSSR